MKVNVIKLLLYIFRSGDRNFLLQTALRIIHGFSNYLFHSISEFELTTFFSLTIFKKCLVEFVIAMQE